MRKKSALLVRHTANSRVCIIVPSLPGRAVAAIRGPHVMSPPDVPDRLGLCLAESSTKHPSDKDLQRADGCGRLVLSGSENGTRIEDVFERSPIRIMFPRNGSCAMEEAVLINTAGGIAGGDRLECSVAALPGASIAVTSQAAEKVYRALN